MEPRGTGIRQDLVISLPQVRGLGTATTLSDRDKSDNAGISHDAADTWAVTRPKGW